MTTMHTQGDLWQAFLITAQSRDPFPALDFMQGEPDLVAERVTFGQLKHAALRAAALLEQHGIRPGDVVALQLKKSIEAYALMLGCLRIGAIYLFLDPHGPAERRLRILSRVQAKILFTEKTSAEVARLGTKVIDRHNSQWLASTWPDPLSDNDQDRECSRSRPAYIMCTSGSTGEPKGAVIPQAGVLDLMEWGRNVIGNPDAHRFLAISPLHFDNSVFDIYCGLLNGATLLPVETSEVQNPVDWARLIKAGAASLVFAVPTLFLLLEKAGLLTPEALPPVRHFLFGGEGFPIQTLRAFYERFRGLATLTNVYGPTETSCICASLDVDDKALAEAGTGIVSLGRMHPSFQYAVLDIDGRAPVSPGETGELWIGGPGVGLGYYADPAESERRFVQDPRQSLYRSIFYRTGDLVRQDARGGLWFAGRADNQVKIAGHRIELEEIDSVLEAHPAVNRCAAVVLRRPGEEGEIAVVFEAGHAVTTAQLADWCGSRLPAYMLPRSFHRVATLPHNANGKLDRRRALEIAQEKSAQQTLGRTAPPATYEVALTKIWTEVLGRPSVDPDTNFFELGGTSLLLLRVHNLITGRLGITVNVTDLFANATISSLARQLGGRNGAGGERLELFDMARSRAQNARRTMRSRD